MYLNHGRFYKNDKKGKLKEGKKAKWSKFLLQNQNFENIQFFKGKVDFASLIYKYIEKRIQNFINQFYLH